jgi:hypothetical protein
MRGEGKKRVIIMIEKTGKDKTRKDKKTQEKKDERYSQCE